MKNERAFNMATKRVFGRKRIEELERVAAFLGDDTEEGKLVWEAVEVMKHLRQAVHGGMLESPAKKWNKPPQWPTCLGCDSDLTGGGDTRRHISVTGHEVMWTDGRIIDQDALEGGWGR